MCNCDSKGRLTIANQYVRVIFVYKEVAETGEDTRVPHQWHCYSPIFNEAHVGNMDIVLCRRRKLRTSKSNWRVPLAAATNVTERFREFWRNNVLVLESLHNHEKSRYQKHYEKWKTATIILAETRERITSVREKATLQLTIRRTFFSLRWFSMPAQMVSEAQ